MAIFEPARGAGPARVGSATASHPLHNPFVVVILVHVRRDLLQPKPIGTQVLWNEMRVRVQQAAAVAVLVGKTGGGDGGVLAVQRSTLLKKKKEETPRH